MVRRGLVPLMLVCMLFVMTACIPENSSVVEITRTVSVSSEGDYWLMAYGGSVYYCKQCFNLLGDYTELYRCREGSVSRISFTTGIAGFEGVYQGNLLLRLTQANFTNYPTKISYILFDPVDGSYRDLPAPVAEFLTQDDLILMAASGDVLFMKKDDQAWYYSPDRDEVEPLTETTQDAVGYPLPEYLYVGIGEQRNLFYGISGSVQQAEYFEDKGRISVRVPDSHLMYYALTTETGSEIRRRDLAGGEDILILETEEEIEAILLFMDDDEDLLYYGVNGENGIYMLRCYDLRQACVDNAFRFTVTLPVVNGYIAAIQVTKKDIVYMVNRRDGSEEVVVAAIPRK